MQNAIFIISRISLVLAYGPRSAYKVQMGERELERIKWTTYAMHGFEYKNTREHVRAYNLFANNGW